VVNLRRIAILFVCAATATACGSSHGVSTTVSHAGSVSKAATTVWSDLTRVSVDVDQPSVAPVPGAKNSPTIFTTPARLATVTKALNANHIRKAAHTTTSNGCTGGIVIAIKITERHHGRTDFNAYHCAHTITGNVSGNLTGFLKQIDVGTT
jgi:hypothetical protein